MRLVSFSTASAAPRPGVLDGDAIRPIDGVASLDALVALDAAARTADHEPARCGRGALRCDPARAALPAQERLLRRAQLSRARRRRRARTRRGVEAAAGADVLQQSADLDRGPRRDAPARRCPLAALRLGSRVGRRDRHSLQGRRRSRCARRRVRLHVPQRRERARPAERDDAVVQGQDARRHLSARAMDRHRRRARRPASARGDLARSTAR